MDVPPSIPSNPCGGRAETLRRVRPHGSGFTLVEVLVVIGILAALIAMLMPMLSGAWEAARRVQCAGNLRQITAATSAYAQQNKGYWPPGHVDFFTKNLRRWHGTRKTSADPFEMTPDSPLARYLQTPLIKELSLIHI